MANDCGNLSFTDKVKALYEKIIDGEYKIDFSVFSKLLQGSSSLQESLNKIDNFNLKEYELSDEDRTGVDKAKKLPQISQSLAGKIAKINPTGTGWNLVDPETAQNLAWGGLIGEIEDQTDLIPYIQKNIDTTFKNFLTQIDYQNNKMEAIHTAVEVGEDIPIPKRLLSAEDISAQWFAGKKTPIVFYGDSTTDGRETTTNGTDLADAWNYDHLVSGQVPSWFNHDHDDSEVPNAYPNIFQRMARDFTKNSTLRVYNAGWRGQRLDDGWARMNVEKAIYNNTAYADAKMIFISFGINDVTLNADKEDLREKTYKETKKLVYDAYARSIQPVIVTNIPISINSETTSNFEMMEIVNNEKIRVAKELNLEIIDINKELKEYMHSNNDNITQAQLTAYDRVHLNDLAYLKFAEILTYKFFSNLIPLISKNKIIDVRDPSLRYTASLPSNGNRVSGINWLNSIGYIADASTVLNEKVVELYVFNTQKNTKLIYSNFRDTLVFADDTKKPTITVTSRNYTALDYNKITRFDGVDPTMFNKCASTRMFDVELCPLEYGLNKIEITMPSANEDNAYSIGYFNFIQRESNNLPYSFSTTTNPKIINSKQNIIWAENSGVDFTNATNSTKYLSELGNRIPISLVKIGSSLTYYLKCSFLPGTGVQLISNKAITSTKDYIELGDTLVAHEASGKLYFSYYNHALAVMQSLATTINTVDIQDKDMVIVLTRNTDNIQIDVSVNSLSWTGNITSANMNGLVSGFTGGVFQKIADNNPVIVAYLDVQK